MKLDRILSIAELITPVISDRVLLKLNGVGSAQFMIDATKTVAKPGDFVVYDIGYSRDAALSRLFMGYVERANQVDGKRKFLFCRELCNALSIPCPLALRHATAWDVLKAVHEQTGVNFYLPGREYAKTRMPNFYNVGDGFQALRQLPRVYQIKDFIWQQNGDGVVYAGAWEDSRWANRPAQIPLSWFDRQLATNTARIPIIPSLRPGAALNEHRITQIEFADSHATFSWTDTSTVTEPG